MIVDDNGEPVDDDTVIDLDAMNDVRLDPFYEMARGPDPFSSQHLFSTDALNAALTGAYDTMPLVSSAAQFAELVGTSALGKAFGSVTMASKISKGLFPDFPLSSSAAEWSRTLGSTITAEMPALPMLDVMAEAGVDGRRLGFDSFSRAVPGPDLDRLIEVAGISQWNDAAIRGVPMTALDAALQGVISGSPMAEQLREFEDRTAAIEDLLRSPALERYSWQAPDAYTPAVEEELVEPAEPVVDPVCGRAGGAGRDRS